LDPFLTGKVALKIDGYWNFPSRSRNIRAISIMELRPTGADAAARKCFKLGERLVFAIPARPRIRKAVGSC
jgi:hypothetical protein